MPSGVGDGSAASLGPRRGSFAGGPASGPERSDRRPAICELLAAPISKGAASGASTDPVRVSSSQWMSVPLATSMAIRAMTV
eukprot:154473-Prymnesium_polylepis.1